MGPFDVECPTCGALVGRYCEGRMSMGSWHGGRVGACQEADTRLARWSDTLAANLSEAGALCRAWDQGYAHRADIDEWPATLLHKRPFYPGCGRKAP